MQQLWFFYAIGAAVLWGLVNVIFEKLTDDGLPPSYVIFLTACMSMPFYLFLVLKLDTFKEGVKLMTENSSIYLWVLALGLATVIGDFLIVMSINYRNATMASLIEISYPIFTVFFAWLILKDLQISLYSGLGGILIFSGIALIYLKG